MPLMHPSALPINVKAEIQYLSAKLLILFVLNIIFSQLHFKQLFSESLHTWQLHFIMIVFVISVFNQWLHFLLSETAQLELELWCCETGVGAGNSHILVLHRGFAHIQTSGIILRHPKLLGFAFYVLCLLQKIEVLLLTHFCPPRAFQIHCLMMVGLLLLLCLGFQWYFTGTEIRNLLEIYH